MKPEKGLDEMEEKQQDPQELFAEIGLLIVEARTPDLSLKGRVEGPHCPPIHGTNDHECDRHKEQCRKARDLIKQQQLLWLNKIPMRIDVLLFPNCEHGYGEETIVEGASFSVDDNFELLERWDVQVVKKRSPERLDGFVSGRIHLQAVRSYLHFSQLSSWLISRGGALPLRVIYRIYAPGETVDYMFGKLPEVHNFPSADMGDIVMTTTVAHLPRQDNPLILACRAPGLGLELHLRNRNQISENMELGNVGKYGSGFEPVPSTSKCEGEDLRNSARPKKSHQKDQMEYGKETTEQIAQKPPIGRKLGDAGMGMSAKGKAKRTSIPCPVSVTPKRKVDQMSPTMQNKHKFAYDVQTSVSPNCASYSPCSNKTAMSFKTDKISESTDAASSVMSSPDELCSKIKMQPYNLSTPVKNLLHHKPSTLSVTTNNPYIVSKRLPSPKVLVTGSSKPEPSMYKKRCIDLAMSECAEESVDSFMTDFKQSDIRDLVKPLSPSDLEAYLSSLSNKASKLPGSSRFEDIPTTKCSFFLGEENVDREMTQNDKKTKSYYNEESVTSSKSGINFSTHENLNSDSNTPSESVQRKLASQKCELDDPSVCDGFVNDGTCNSVTARPCDQPSHVRALFQKSLSTSEVEDQLNYNKSSQTEGKNIQQDIPHISGHTLVEEFNVENEFHENQRKIPKGSAVKNKRGKLDVNKAKEELLFLQKSESNNENASSICGTNDNSKSHISLSEQSCQFQTEKIASDSKKREETPCNSQTSREKTLNELSIPCKIGAVNSVMTTLVQNLESMEIDDISNQTNGAQSHIFESPVLDREVETHLSGEMTAKGSSMATSPATSCDSLDTCDNSQGETRGLSLCKQLLRKEFHQNVKNEMLSPGCRAYKNLPSPDDISNFHFMMGQSTSALFNINTGLPSRSSPAPVKKKASNRFDYDCSLTNVRAIKNAISCSKLTLQSEDNADTIEDPKIISTSAPASTNCLLGNFEESVLNGRIEPVGVVDGFTVEIGAGGTFCPKHVILPVAAYFFHLSDDNAPSPYLGHVNLEPLGKRGYHIPRNGTVQVTLFNPNKTVVKMFVVMYDLSDMPANCQTFLRQRTIYMPADKNSTEPSYLRYLIHLRFSSSKSGKVYLHTDIRLIFARDKFEFDPQVANYELRSFTEGPDNPKFSPKR